MSRVGAFGACAQILGEHKRPSRCRDHFGAAPEVPEFLSQPLSAAVHLRAAGEISADGLESKKGEEIFFDTGKMRINP